MSRSRVAQPRAEMQVKFAGVFEKTAENYSAYLPDLPGRVATGESREEVERNIREAVAFHLDGVRAGGLPIPEAAAWTEFLEAQV